MAGYGGSTLQPTVYRVLKFLRAVPIPNRPYPLPSLRRSQFHSIQTNIPPPHHPPHLVVYWNSFECFFLLQCFQNNFLQIYKFFKPSEIISMSRHLFSNHSQLGFLNLYLDFSSPGGGGRLKSSSPLNSSSIF